jgi:hypothetical protein
VRGDSRLVVTRSSTGTSEPQTKASWRVSDLTAEVTELRSRGVEIQEFDEPWLRTVDGVADEAAPAAAEADQPSLRSRITRVGADCVRTSMMTLRGVPSAASSRCVARMM